MPNLVGIGNSQVPTNSMLGGLAYQDPENVLIKNAEIENLAAIKAASGDTAQTRGIFVYDTRKDSDGGAWRKRTQHCSWYNEDPSPIRGTRKEFPAVAVLVKTTTRLIIYDGDDPNLSMWREFWFSENGTNAYVGQGLAAANGIIALAFNGVFPGATWITLIGDWMEFRDERNDAGTNRRVYNPIASAPRDVYSRLTERWALAGDHVTDVAVRILPNSPIDKVFGTDLPRPTFAFATDEGVSVVTDHDRVIDYIYTSTNDTNNFVDISPNGFLRYGARSFGCSPSHLIGNFYIFSYNGLVADGFYGSQDIAKHDTQPDMWYSYNSSGGNGTYQIGGVVGSQNTPYHDLVHIDDQEFIVATCKSSSGSNQIDGQKGVVRIIEPPVNRGLDSEGEMNKPIMINYITSTYNTGWLAGSQVGCYLCEAVDSATLNEEYVANGNFDDNTTGWSNSGGTLSVESNQAKYVTTGNQNAYQQVTGLTVGKTYKYKYTHVSGYTSAYIGPNSTSADPNVSVGDVNSGSSVVKQITWQATSTNPYVVVYGIGSATHKFDSVSLKESHDLNANQDFLEMTGTFGSASGWNVGTWTVSGNVATSGSGNDSIWRTCNNLVIGKTYCISVDVTTNNGNLYFYAPPSYGDHPISGTGTKVTFFTADAVAENIGVTNLGTTGNVIDNLKVTVADGNRSNRQGTNSGGLQVHGIVPREPVAKGAELLGYGPFATTSDYLSQPYDAALNWGGNTHWHVSFWIYHTQNDAYDAPMSRWHSSGNVWTIEGGNDNSLAWKATGGSVRCNIPSDNQFNAWRHFVFTFDGTEMQGYRDGILMSTYKCNDNYTNSDAQLYVGKYPGGSTAAVDTSKLALIRIGKGGLTPDQVKRIYNDEKKLFAENAKCTLYGSSDIAAAIAYDDGTKNVHVGTSSGRSDFNGLVRINNTTTEVTHAISASNGLIVEQ